MIRTVWQSSKRFFNRNRKTICVLLALLLFVAIAQHLGLDESFIVILVVFLGYITHLFAALVGLIALIPVIGPPVAGIISLPFFLIVNAIAYLVTLFSLRRGYAKNVVDSKVMVTALLVGIIIGYALGKLF
jgi:hypothetical protein